jgi:hypothetical protein
MCVCVCVCGACVPRPILRPVPEYIIMAAVQRAAVAAGAVVAKRAAACVIGDELLNGKVLDTNTHELAKVLFQAWARVHSDSPRPRVGRCAPTTACSWARPRYR